MLGIYKLSEVGWAAILNVFHTLTPESSVERIRSNGTCL